MLSNCLLVGTKLILQDELIKKSAYQSDEQDIAQNYHDLSIQDWYESIQNEQEFGDTSPVDE